MNSYEKIMWGKIIGLFHLNLVVLKFQKQFEGTGFHGVDHNSGWG